MKNLEINRLPTTASDALLWGVGIAAGTWLSWWVGRRLEAYVATTQGDLHYPYHPRF